MCSKNCIKKQRHIIIKIAIYNLLSVNHHAFIAFRCVVINILYLKFKENQLLLNSFHFYCLLWVFKELIPNFIAFTHFIPFPPLKNTQL